MLVAYRPIHCITFKMYFIKRFYNYIIKFLQIYFKF